ncbi:MAG TPA: DUF3102 domain-containing protein [Pyrinomonadaceae bacterium]|jgi:hypothetical protein
MSSAVTTPSPNAGVIPPELRVKGWKLRRDKESGKFYAENERFGMKTALCERELHAVAAACEMDVEHEEKNAPNALPVMPFIARLALIKTPSDFQHFLDEHNLHNVPYIDEARDERFTPTGQKALKQALDECSRRLYAERNDFVVEPDAALVAPDPEQLTFSFDYSALDEDTRDVVQTCTREIKERLGTIRNSIVEVGERLQTIKENLGHGKFGEWLKAEFQGSISSAEKWMRAARFFVENPRFRGLEDQLGQSAIYVLSAPSTPEGAREEAAERAAAGEQITHSTAKEIVDSHKPVTSTQDQPLARPWTSDDVVAAIRERGPLTLMALEDLGCERYPIIIAEQDGLIRRGESGSYELTSQPLMIIEEAEVADNVPSASATGAVAHVEEKATEEAPPASETPSPSTRPPAATTTTTASARPATQERAHAEAAARPSIETLLRGRPVAVTFTFNMPGVKGLAQVSVMADGKVSEASRELLAVSEVRFPEPVMKQIQEKLGVKNKPASAPTKKGDAQPKIASQKRKPAQKSSARSSKKAITKKSAAKSSARSSKKSRTRATK